MTVNNFFGSKTLAGSTHIGTGIGQSQQPPAYPGAIVRHEVTEAVQGVSGYQVNKLTLDLKQAQQRYDTRRGQQEVLQKQYDEALVRKTEAEKLLGNLDLVQILLQKTSDYARQQAKTRIEAIVSEALNVVYGGNHRFMIDLVVRSNRPEADYYLSCDGVVTQLKPPDYGRGGGKIDVITLALRLSIIEILQTPGPIFLDEVGKHIDNETDPDGTAAENLAYFLHEYAHKFNRQIVLITHNSALAERGDAGLQVRKKTTKAEVKSYDTN